MKSFFKINNELHSACLGLLVGTFLFSLFSWCDYFYSFKAGNVFFIAILSVSSFMMGRNLFYSKRPIKTILFKIPILISGIVIYFLFKMGINPHLTISGMSFLVCSILGIYTQRNTTNLKYLAIGILISSLSIFIPLNALYLILIGFVMALTLIEFELKKSTIVFFLGFTIGFLAIHKIRFFDEQWKTNEPILAEISSKNDLITITSKKSWKNIYVNGIRALSTDDSYKLYESMLATAGIYNESNKNILVIGEDLAIVHLAQFIKGIKKTYWIQNRNMVAQSVISTADVSFESTSYSVITRDDLSQLKEIDLVILNLLVPGDYGHWLNKTQLEKLSSILSENGQLIVKGFNPNTNPLSNSFINKSLGELFESTKEFHLGLNSVGEISWYVGYMGADKSKTRFLPLDQFWFNESSLDQVSLWGKSGSPISDNPKILRLPFKEVLSLDSVNYKL